MTVADEQFTRSEDESSLFQAVVHNNDTAMIVGVRRAETIPDAIKNAMLSRAAERAGCGEFNFEVYAVIPAISLATPPHSPMTLSEFAPMPDIVELNARGLKLLNKLGMLSPAERSLVDPYVACLELYLEETRPAPAQTPTSNVVSFEDATIARRVQRAELQRRRVAEVRKAGQHLRVDEYGWEVYDDE